MEFAGTACWVGKRCKESRAIAAKVVGRGPGHKGPSEEHRSRAADQRQAADASYFLHMFFASLFFGRPMRRAE